MDLQGKWEELTPAQQRGIAIVGLITSVMQVAMLWDLWRRPAGRIRGSKRVWVVASFVRPFGQVAYLLWGRRPIDR